MTVDTAYATDKNADLRNPERGIYCSIEPTEGQSHTLVAKWLWLASVCKENLTWHGLDHPDTHPKLREYAQQLEACRGVGVKVLFRPRYDQIDPATGLDLPSDCGIDGVGLYHADTMARQINHIDAVAAMLGEYRDVIAYIQAGYLGCWGEWNTAETGAEDENAPFLHDGALRAQVIDHVLFAYAAHGIEQHVELRRPVFAKEVLDRNPNANVGLHNDCFMTNESDRGTYSNFDDSSSNFASSAAAKAWAECLTTNKSFGGETCPITDKPNEAGFHTERWRQCSNMVSENTRPEPATLHMNYLNGEHAPDAVETWQEGDCYDEIRRKLGYRFKVTRVEYTPTVAHGQRLSVSIDIANSGWARLHKHRDAQLVLRSGSTTRAYSLSNGATEKWAPGTTAQVSVTDAPPPAGTYEVRLAIPDPDAPEREPGGPSSFPDAPEPFPYSVKLASLRNGKNVFDESTGENNLGVSITVQ